jgi:septal ring factor EnvC (AmiA/AmiB activator)
MGIFSKFVHRIPFRASSSYTLMGKLKAENASEKVISLVQTHVAEKDNEFSVIQRELLSTQDELIAATKEVGATLDKLIAANDEIYDLKKKGVSFLEIYRLARFRSFQGMYLMLALVPT